MHHTSLVLTVWHFSAELCGPSSSVTSFHTNSESNSAGLTRPGQPPDPLNCDQGAPPSYWPSRASCSGLELVSHGPSDRGQLSLLIWGKLSSDWLRCPTFYHRLDWETLYSLLISGVEPPASDRSPVWEGPASPARLVPSRPESELSRSCRNLNLLKADVDFILTWSKELKVHMTLGKIR